MRRKWLVSAIVTTVLAFAAVASAQYMPPGGMGPMGSTPGSTGTTPTYTKKSYGVNKAAMGAVIGGGVAGGVLLFRHFHHPTLTACVGPSGTTLDDGKDIYSLVGGPLTPGERVVASGKKVESDTGTPAFEMSSVRKDLGRCGTSTTASAQQR